MAQKIYKTIYPVPKIIIDNYNYIPKVISLGPYKNNKDLKNYINLNDIKIDEMNYEDIYNYYYNFEKNDINIIDIQKDIIFVSNFIIAYDNVYRYIYPLNDKYIFIQRYYILNDILLLENQLPMKYLYIEIKKLINNYSKYNKDKDEIKKYKDNRIIDDNNIQIDEKIHLLIGNILNIINPFRDTHNTNRSNNIINLQKKLYNCEHLLDGLYYILTHDDNDDNNDANEEYELPQLKYQDAIVPRIKELVKSGINIKSYISNKIIENKI